jgi:hypothetical protein
MKDIKNKYRRRFVTETFCYRRRFVKETFCKGDVVCIDVLSRRRFVEEPFCMCAVFCILYLYKSVYGKFCLNCFMQVLLS